MARPGVGEPQASELTVGPLGQVLAGPACDGEDIRRYRLGRDSRAIFDFDVAVALQEHYRVAA